MRAKYLSKVRSLLTPDGRYIGIIRGPRVPEPTSQPYAFSRTQLEDFFQPLFSSVEITLTVSGHGGSTSSYWLVQARRD
jgi:hypothetical protein